MLIESAIAASPRNSQISIDVRLDGEGGFVCRSRTARRRCRRSWFATFWERRPPASRSRSRCRLAQYEPDDQPRRDRGARRQDAAELDDGRRHDRQADAAEGAAVAVGVAIAASAGRTIEATPAPAPLGWSGTSRRRCGSLLGDAIADGVSRSDRLSVEPLTSCDRRRMRVLVANGRRMQNNSNASDRLRIDKPYWVRVCLIERSEAESHMFKLLRHFSVMSALATAAITTVLVLGFHWNETPQSRPARRRPERCAGL